MNLTKNQIGNTLFNVALYILIGLMVFEVFFNKEEPTEPQPIQVIIPEQKGSTGEVVVNPTNPITVVIPEKGEIIVDDTWRQEYLNAKDSITRLNKYLQAIQIKDTAITFVNNDTIEIKGDLQTRGQLTKYKVDYTIKEKIFEYTPKEIIRRPKLSMSLESSAGIPTAPNSNFSMQGKLGLENKRGEALLVGYDTENRVWLGLRKSFSIIK